MSEFRKLSGPEAAALMDTDPDAVVFPIKDFLLIFELTWAELHPELLSERIIATARKTPDGWADICISAKQYIDWTQNPDTPEHLVEKARAAVRGSRNARLAN